MAAGTVISGGFPGRVAQEVQPNPKCRGCLHYNDQGGRTGACGIGLRPWLCGDGEAQDIGYAPIDAGAGAYLPDMSNHGAQAPQTAPQSSSEMHGAGSTRPVMIQQVSLGEEHVHIVKSMVEQHVRFERSQCRGCLNRGAIGTAPANVGPQTCTCRPLEAIVVAKTLAKSMTNAQRASWTDDELADWVRDIVKSGFKFPSKKARSLGSRTMDTNRHAEGKKRDSAKRLAEQYQPTASDRSGGHLQLRTCKSEPSSED